MLTCVKCELRAAAGVQERTGQDRPGRNMLEQSHWNTNMLVHTAAVCATCVVHKGTPRNMLCSLLPILQTGSFLASQDAQEVMLVSDPD